MLELYYNPNVDKEGLLDLEKLFHSLLAITFVDSGKSLLEVAEECNGKMSNDFYNRVSNEEKLDPTNPLPWLFKVDDDFSFRMYTKKQDLLYIVSFLAFSRKLNKEEHWIMSEWEDKTISFFLNEFFMKIKSAPEDELAVLLWNIAFILYKNSNKKFSEKEIKDIIAVIQFYLKE